jgi:hypothetical protein
MVSPAELERYETEQFRIEAEAEAIAMRTEAEYLACRQLQKNAKAPNTNKRSRMLSGLRRAVEPSARGKGRSIGRQGKGRGRSGGLMLSFRQLTDDMDEELVDIEPTAFKSPTENIRQPMQISPGVVRSAFVANSALSVRGSSPSATVSLTAVDVSQHTTPSSDGSPIAVSDTDDVVPAQPPPPSHEFNEDMNNYIIHMHTTHSDPQSLQHENNDNADADGAEEYVVEAIIEHFQEDGEVYYLVKWDGYEDSYDWLLEEDLDGAADLVAEYKERVGGKNKRVKIR